MYNAVSNEFKTINSQSGRTFRARFSAVSSGIEISAEILNLKITAGNTSSDDISVGDVSSTAVSVEFAYQEGIENDVYPEITMRLDIGLQLIDGFEYVPMGVFTVTDCKKNGEKFTVSLADKLYGSDTAYTSGLMFPNNAENIVKEIINDLGIGSFAAEGIDLKAMTFSAVPTNLTMRQMLSYIASYFGTDANIDRNGALTFGWYRFSAPVVLNADDIAEPTIGDEINIASLACAVSQELTLTSLAGRALTFENPFMTQSQLDAIADKLTKSYSVAEVNQLVGNILVDSHDCLMYNGKLIPVMSSELSFDGGVSVKYRSVGKSGEDAQKKTVSKLDVVINQIKRYADDAIKNTTEIMNGTNGGYKIEKYDADGNPYATLYLDAPDEKTAAHCVMLGKNGIGFGAKNAGDENWSFVQGWTIDGSFNTEFITSRNLSLTGSLTDGKLAEIENEEVEMHYELSKNLELYSKNGKHLDAVGLKASSSLNGVENHSYYTNFGAFFDAAANTPLDTLMSGIIGILGNKNYYSNGGFRVSDGIDEILGSPAAGFDATKGIYDNGIRCLTEATGMINGIGNGYLADCNEPSVSPLSNAKVCVDIFNAKSLNSPFEGSVGYILTLNWFSVTSKYLVQIAIRYRDNQIKMRSYNKVNGNADGTNPAWSDWSSTFAMQSAVDSLNTKVEENDKSLLYLISSCYSYVQDIFEGSYDNSTQIGWSYNSIAKVMTMWGTAIVSKSGTTINFPEEYTNNKYGISITPFGLNIGVWFTSPTSKSFRIYASQDDTTVKWMTIGE